MTGAERKAESAARAQGAESAGQVSGLSLQQAEELNRLGPLREICAPDQRVLGAISAQLPT